MDDSTLREHLTIVTLLPDYALGALDEASQRLVARHLEECATCRAEFANALDALAHLAEVAPPPARGRDDLLRRAAAEKPHDDRQWATAIPPRGPGSLARAQSGPPRWRWLAQHPAIVAASLAAMLIVGAIGARGALSLPFGAAPNDGVFSSAAEPEAFPLEDSDLSAEAAGVLFAEPDGREMLLVASGLPPLPGDQRYQVWLFTTDDELVSAGLVNAGNSGEVRVVLRTPEPFANYVGVGLTAEPQGGSAAPTSGMVLGGSLPPMDPIPPESA